MCGSSCEVENGLVTLAPAPEDAPPPPFASAVIGAATGCAIAGGATLVAVVVEIKDGALVGGAVTLEAGTACAAGGSVAVTVVAVVVPVAVVVVVADVVEVAAPAAAGAALAVLVVAALVEAKGLVDAVEVALASDDDEPVAASAAVVLPLVPPPIAGAVVAVALAAAAFESESAWFVLPLRFEYFWFTEPEGDVAPSSTAVEPVSNRLATDAAVCTSPRTSIVVSRWPRQAIPPGARTLLAWSELTTSVVVKP